MRPLLRALLLLAALILLAPLARGYNELPPANLWFGASGSISATATKYLGPFNANTSENSASAPVAIACTATAIWVKLAANVTGTGASYKFTLRDNAADTAVTTTVNSGAALANNTGFAVAIAAGDLIDVSAAPQSSPSNAPTVTGIAVTCI